MSCQCDRLVAEIARANAFGDHLLQQQRFRLNVLFTARQIRGPDGREKIEIFLIVVLCTVEHEEDPREQYLLQPFHRRVPASSDRLQRLMQVREDAISASQTDILPVAKIQIDGSASHPGLLSDVFHGDTMVSVPLQQRICRIQDRLAYLLSQSVLPVTGLCTLHIICVMCIVYMKTRERVKRRNHLFLRTPGSLGERFDYGIRRYYGLADVMS